VSNETKYDPFSSDMKIPKGEYQVTNASYHKDPYGSGWSFEVRGKIDTANFLPEEIVLVEKSKLEDLKNENDQCLLEIERLTKLVDELQGKNDQLEVKNKNQAKILNRDGFGYSKKYYDTIGKNQKYIVTK
jgi:hypothetical protein